MSSAPPSGYSWTNQRTISNGDQGGDVLGAQSVLHFMGFLTGTVSVIDGAFGPNTESAVKAYQSAYGLSVDGIVGPNTWSSLQQWLAQDGTSSPYYEYNVNYESGSSHWFAYQTSTGYWCVKYPSEGDAYYWMENGFYQNILF
ncbi:peptidoglycan-binding domain-containing protein [Alicyclobacillus ferrooxydans]|uniref:peptidoglycan-binding domain-containing protein n=1 Tax=Alicyclobacillus ferrooxydans TaxID=471514 RepID=UPI0006D55852|nr:peptidoglycan-binding domain-containing protein [Alicyclobacillus ferrooxydans]